MGCDGGTIPRRDELVRLKKKPEQKDKDAELAFKWKHCNLTQEKLQKPIVGCGHGRLYSKMSLIEALLDKDNIPDNIKHIKNLKDIKDLKLTPNPAYKETDITEGAVDGRGAPHICPISGLEMSGKFRFVFLWSCGCVFAERALKEIKTKICHMCQKPFADEDVIIINGNDEDVEILKSRMEVRQSAVKNKKKTKAVKSETPATATVKEVKETSTASSSEGSFKVPITNGNQGPSTSKKEEAPEMETIPLMLPRPNKEPGLSSIMKPHKRRAPENIMQDPVYKKTKDDYSVAKDPKATEVYKSIFTSHSSERQQQRAHWITYNPFYN